MNEQIIPEKHKTPQFARYVRLTPEENAQLEEDQTRTGRSAQDLLRSAYFGKGRVIILMTDEDKDTFLGQINRIGNNVNQIAKKLNTGIIYGFDDDITQVRILLTNLMRWITAKYTHFRDQRETF